MLKCQELAGGRGEISTRWFSNLSAFLISVSQYHHLIKNKPPVVGGRAEVLFFAMSCAAHGRWGQHPEVILV